MKIYNQYGKQHLSGHQENPYQMADDINGVGFRIADEIASKVGIHAGFRLSDPLRSALCFAAGHERGPRFSAEGDSGKRTVDLLGVSQEAVEKHIMDLAVDRKLVAKETEEQSLCLRGPRPIMWS
ncbi:MAG: helix-hairpin-helix domain-containing protein [Lachnospiraceae bacterium]